MLPLISREFSITAVTTVPTSGSTQGVVTISSTDGVGFTIETTLSTNITTGYFYREVAYSVYNGQLRYHANFTSTNKTSCVVVRGNVTSPQPFALLFPSSSSQVDNLALRVSLEAYDTNYSSKAFTNGAATLQAIVPPLTIPTPVSATDSI